MWRAQVSQVVWDAQWGIKMPDSYPLIAIAFKKGFPKSLDTYQPFFLRLFLRDENPKFRTKKLSREIDQSQTMENGMYLIE